MSTVVVTGVAGCIGSWIARHLLDEGHRVVGLDVVPELPNGRLLGIEDALDLRMLDATDAHRYREVLASEDPDAVIHLASLLMPRCKSDPLACVDVNVKSFMTVLEAAREQRFNVAYASSAWVLKNAPGNRPVTEEDPVDPQSLYGVFKATNEGMAKAYARDFAVNVNGLRPYIVYGPGRETGLTADINLALLAAARNESYRIGFGGEVALHHAADIASLFARLALEPAATGRVYNVRGTVESMDGVIRAIERVTGTHGSVDSEETPLPIAANLSDALLQTDYGPFEYRSLDEGFAETLELYGRVGGPS